MGPYYVTALVSLLGPARRVVGSARVTFPERVVSSEPEKGRRIRVEVPTHVAGIVDFASGAVAVIVTSFDVWASELPRIEIHGTEGSMLVPDPNSFDGPVRIRRAGDEAWADVPLTHPGNTGRGIGVADMAYAILQDRPHRASDGLAGHVLDILEAFPDSSEKACHVLLSSTCVRPAALPPGTDSRLLVRS
jgi:predicted dehydrogenase